MRKSSILLLWWLVMLQLEPSRANEVIFISTPEDSLFWKTYCWQSGNPSRPVLRLDGEWEYKITEKNPFSNVTLPASCNFLGEITFRKSFVPDSTFSDHFFRLVCYGINYSCRIFINEILIGSHSNGYCSFAFDIAEGIIQLNHKNIIEIKVDTRLDSKKTIPHRFQPDGISDTAGIFRSIYLLALPENSIEDLAVDYQFAPDFSQADLVVNFQLKDRVDNFSDQANFKNTSEFLIYDIELFERISGVTVLQERKEIEIKNYVLTRSISTVLRLKQPHLWSPEFPFLYTFRIKLSRQGKLIDQFDQTLGIKHIDFHAGDIYLNGKRLILKGVNWAEDYLVSGAIFDRCRLQKDLELAKQLQANAIRVLNHPAHPWLTVLCDSLGLFLLQEIPLNWMPTQRFASDIFVSRCTDYLYEMINRDKAHVSMLGWGIGGNFLFNDPQSKIFMKKVTKMVSKPDKQFFYFSNTPPLSNSNIDTNIIAGISIFSLKKNQILHELAQWTKQNKGKLNLVLSYGAPKLSISSIRDHNALYEEYQVSQIVEAWRAITSIKEIDGYFISSLSDYKGNYASTLFGDGVIAKLRPFGLTDQSRKQRAAFETVRSLYLEGNAHSNPELDIKDELPIAFPIVGLGAILVFLFMFNSRRYARENFKRVFIHPHGFYVDIRDGRKIPVSHTISIAVFISIGCGLMLTSLLLFYKNLPYIDHILTLLLPAENLKMNICSLAWNPGWAILFFSMLSLMIFLFIASYLKFIAIITRKRCALVQALMLSFWIGVNFIIFIPIGIVLFRLLHYEQLTIPIFVCIFLIMLWFILRMAKGMRVIFIWTLPRSLIVLIFSILAALVGILYYYQYHYALIDYIKFYYQIYGENVVNAYLP